MGQRAGLEKNAVGDRQFAYVMQPSSHGDIPELMLLQATQGFPNLDRVQEYSAGMSRGRTVPELAGRSQHFQPVIVAALDLAQRLPKLVGHFLSRFLTIVAVI